MAAPKKPAGSARAAASIPQVPWHKVRPAPVILVTGPEDFLAVYQCGELDAEENEVAA